MSEATAEDWTLVHRSISRTGQGIVYVEARLKDDSRDVDLGPEASTHRIPPFFLQLSASCYPTDGTKIPQITVCSHLEDIVNQEFVALELWEELLTDESSSNMFPDYLVSVKAVEYTGNDLPAASSLVPLQNGTKVCVQLYRMHPASSDPQDSSLADALLQAEIITLPSIRFQNLWETLIFDEDLRNGLVLTLTNMVKFGKRLGSNKSQMNRLVLLYGYPGTGKSSLAQSLAQKISIRLQFGSTKLIQINAATLLSKYFSESALQIHNIFAAIEKLCQSNKDFFVCVLIDEIESLAASRTAAAGRNETHDSIRATNALLTGLDRVRSQPNLIILCTSNLVKTLDAAFMDRCGLVMAVDPPSTAAAYEIVRGELKKLIKVKIINCESDIPSFRDAQMTLLSQPEAPSSRLFNIVEELMSPERSCLVDGMVVSGRFLGQLAEQALSRSLRKDSCTLQEALDLIEAFISSHGNRGQKRKRQEVDDIALFR